MRSRRASLLLPALALALLLGFAGCRKRADLLAAGALPDVAPACLLDADGRLLITIRNLGKREAKATTTQVEFANLPPVRLPTRPIPPRGSETVAYRIPEECFNPDCRYRITVDALDEVQETDESNNSSESLCPGPDGKSSRTGT